MSQTEMLLKLRKLVIKLEAQQRQIDRLLLQDDPELVLLGQYQKQVVDEYHTLLVDLIAQAQQDDTTNLKPPP